MVRIVGIDLGVRCVVASSTSEDRYAIKINKNDMSGPSTPSAVSYDGKLRYVGVRAEKRLLSAPKQTLSHLPLALVPSEAMQKRAEKYQFLFPFQEDGTLGPVNFNGDSVAVSPAGALALLLKTLISYAQTSTEEKTQLCIGVPDYYSDKELAVVNDALKLCDNVEAVDLLRHSEAVATAFAHGQGSSLLPDGTDERCVGFVDIGSSQGTVSVVKFFRKEDGVAADFLYRCSEEALGVESMATSLRSEAISRIEQEHNYKVQLRTEAGVFLAKQAMKALIQLSTSEHAQMEAWLPMGPQGLGATVWVPLTRQLFETAAAEVLKRLKEVLTEAMEFKPEAFELLGGGSSIPGVRTRVKDIAGELPLRFALDRPSVAAGAAAFAAGKRMLEALEAPVEGLAPDVLESIRQKEAEMEAIQNEEVAQWYELRYFDEEVSAMNVPPPSAAEEGRKGFATDAEISRKETESHRELEPWQGDGYGPGVGLEEGAHHEKWDQFQANKDMYGVSTTWHEDIYTTKLDKSQVPADQREKADQIAREIESGNMHAEVEDRVDGDIDGDEEARFSAVNSSKALARPLPQVPERPGQDIAGGQERRERPATLPGSEHADAGRTAAHRLNQTFPRDAENASPGPEPTMEALQMRLKTAEQNNEHLRAQLEAMTAALEEQARASAEAVQAEAPAAGDEMEAESDINLPHLGQANACCHQC